MVRLDHGLIRRARTLINGANVRRAKEMIFVYQQVVRLHNKGSHVVYQPQCEQQLRHFTEREGRAASVAWRDSNHLDEPNYGILERARKAIERAERIQERCQDLAADVNNALGRTAALPSGKVEFYD